MKGHGRDGGGGRGTGAEDLSRKSLAKAEELLPPMLDGVLHHAKVSDVTALVLKQLGWGLLSEACWQKRIEEAGQEPVDWDARCDQVAEETCKAALDRQYVTDCERIARLVDPGTPLEEQGKIVLFYRERYESWVREVIEEMLRARLGRHFAPAGVEDAFMRVEETLFGFQAFLDNAKKYAPARGRTFERFFCWRAIRRCVEAAYDKDPNAVFTGFDDACEVPEKSTDQKRSEETELRRRERVIAWLRKGMDDLEQLGKTQNPDLGHELRAVMELWAKAYWDPDNMGWWTERRVGSSNFRMIKSEYQECQVELKELVEIRLGEAHSMYLDTYAIARSYREQLGDIPESQLHRLKAQALGRDLGDLERELKGVQAGRGRGHSAEELEYMLAWARFEQARWGYEKVRAQWERWCQLRLPWVRAEEVIGGLVGLSQETVSRRLKVARVGLRKMGTLPRDDEDEPEEDQKCQGRDRGDMSTKESETRRGGKRRGKEQEDQHSNEGNGDLT